MSKHRTKPIGLKNIHKTHGFKKRHPDKIIIDRLENEKEANEITINNLQARDLDRRDEIEELKDLLQYVANEHLCGTPLIKDMKKHGIEYNKPDKDER